MTDVKSTTIIKVSHTIISAMKRDITIPNVTGGYFTTGCPAQHSYGKKYEKIKRLTTKVGIKFPIFAAVVELFNFAEVLILCTNWWQNLCDVSIFTAKLTAF